MSEGDSWSEARLGDLSTFIGSGVTPRGGSKVYTSSGVPFLRSQNVHFGGLRLDDVAFIPPELHAELDRTHVRPDDVLLNITGASIGRCTTVPEDLGPANVNQHVCIIRTDRARMEGKFVAYYIESRRGQAQVFGRQAGLSREALNYEQVRSFSVPTPPIPEQRKIAAILSSVDDTIEKTQSVIDQLEVIKKGVLEELLTRGIPGRHARFKHSAIGDIPATWRICRLDEIAEVRTGLAKNSKRSSSNTVELPYLRVANVQDGYLDLQEIKTIRVDIALTERYLLRDGDVLFNEGGDADKVGRGTVWRGQIPKCTHQNHVFAVRPSPHITSDFLSLLGGAKK